MDTMQRFYKVVILDYVNGHLTLCEDGKMRLSTNTNPFPGMAPCRFSSEDEALVYAAKVRGATVWATIADK